MLKISITHFDITKTSKSKNEKEKSSTAMEDPGAKFGQRLAAVLLAHLHLTPINHNKINAVYVLRSLHPLSKSQINMALYGCPLT